MKNRKYSKSIIEQMHAKWNGKWPKYMKFEQNVFLYKNNKVVKEEVWQEILSSPQNLHIRFDGFNSGNGMLFREDSVYYFKNNQIINKEKRIHQLILLGFDVYHQAPELTEKKLIELGFDFKKFYETAIEERKVIVIGTDNKRDVNSSQFWIDTENLYLLRVILNKDTSQSDITFGNYVTIENFPVATEITFMMNKELVMIEKYFNITFPSKVDKQLFDPVNFKNIVW